MDTSARFFSKLRNLAVSLETETASLHHKHQHFEEDDDVNTEGAVRVLHDLHSDVRTLKGQVQDQLGSQQAREEELRRFINACMVLKKRSTEDIQRLQEHFEKYGYQAPKNTQTCSGPTAEGQEEEAEMEVGEEHQEADEGTPLPPVTPEKLLAALPVDRMRTPQLSDYGLSEIHLERLLGGAGWAKPTPVMPLCPPGLAKQPPTPKTPKCALRLDEDSPLTPRIEDFGISEHTMCLNNDFTMDLHLRKPSKTASSSACSGLAARAPHLLFTPPSHSGMHSQAAEESMESPELPVLCTPGLKFSKSPGRAPLPPPGPGDPGSSSPPPPATEVCRSPERPAFESLYLTGLLSGRQGEGECAVAASLVEQAQQRPALSRPWGTESSDHTPEKPRLDSANHSSATESVRVNGAGPERRTALSTTVDPDGPTQEFDLGSPQVSGRYAEPSTPKMPDLSSVTQDICKLVSQMKKPPCWDSSDSTHREREQTSPAVAPVSETEFLSLPGYLRQVSLSSLNQAIQRINSAVQDQPWGSDAGFLIEELKRIIGVGAKAPMFFLCLTELRRLEQVQGVGTSTVYRVLSHA